MMISAARPSILKDVALLAIVFVLTMTVAGVVDLLQV